MRSNILCILLIGYFSCTIAYAQEEAKNKLSRWPNIVNEEIVTYEATYIESNVEDNNLRGIRIGGSVWGPDDLFIAGGAAMWIGLSRKSNRSKAEVGTGIRIFCFALGPVQISPNLSFLVEYQDLEFHKGFDAGAGLGGDIGLWLGRKAQLAIFADRLSTFSSGTRSQFGILLRIPTQRFPWWKKEDL